jgi:hypothetical protein
MIRDHKAPRETMVDRDRQEVKVRKETGANQDLADHRVKP